MVLVEKTSCRRTLVRNSKFVDLSDDVILQGITHKKLTFSKHVDNLYRNAQYKLHALRRIRKFITVKKLS